MTEPLYCTQCGSEIGDCECWDPAGLGPFCDATGNEKLGCDCEDCSPELYEEDPCEVEE